MLPLSLLIALAIIIGLCSARAPPAWQLEHSFDGGRTFSPAGTIQGQTEGQLELQRAPSDAAQQAQLAGLVEADG
jgi:hypothetical protein